MHTSLENQRRQQRAVETAQLLKRFVHQAESLLDKDSLDPNKRSVLRYLAIDALRGNTGRGDPNYTRLARLCKWLADEAEATQDDAACSRLVDPVLRQYAETAEQLYLRSARAPRSGLPSSCVISRVWPRAVPPPCPSNPARTLQLRHPLPTFR